MDSLRQLEEISRQFGNRNPLEGYRGRDDVGYLGRGEYIAPFPDYPVEEPELIQFLATELEYEINDFLRLTPYNIRVNLTPSEGKTTLLDYDNTFTVKLYHRNQTPIVEAGEMVIVIDNFLINYRYQGQKYTGSGDMIFIDYTLVEDIFRGTGLSKIFMLYTIALSEKLGSIPVVSHDTAFGGTGYKRYAQYGFISVDGEISYNGHDSDEDEDEHEDEDEDEINNILLPKNVSTAKQKLIEKIS